MKNNETKLKKITIKYLKTIDPNRDFHDNETVGQKTVFSTNDE